jgi:hypothetical protein
MNSARLTIELLQVAPQRAPLWYDPAMERYLEDIQGKTYPGFGRCIFCNSEGADGGLRKEHIIPKSLGGNAVIADAGCKSCEAITSYIDGYLGRHIFYEYRAHAGTRTRRPKERPTEFPALIVLDGVEEVRHIKTPDHPYFLALPVWGLPTALTAKPPSETFEHHKAHIYEFIPENMRDTLSIPDGIALQIRGTGSINYTAFARAIAKIAYCHAVLRYGLDGFVKFPLPEVILGSNAYVSHFVGCELDDPPPPARRGRLHTVDFDIWDNGGVAVIVVSVRYRVGGIVAGADWG